MSLFKLGDFVSHSGRILDWKIDCDALTNEDWEALAYIARHDLDTRFKGVIGIPTGGSQFAKSLSQYCSDDPELPYLIVDDVLTTGQSMIEARRKVRIELPNIGKIHGLVVFTRGLGPAWVTSMFSVNGLIMSKPRPCYNSKGLRR